MASGTGISNITAEGVFVKIILTNGEIQRIGRREALLRANALNQMRGPENPEAGDLTESFIQAILDSYRNEHGKPHPREKDLRLLQNAKTQELTAKKFGRR